MMNRSVLGVALAGLLSWSSAAMAQDSAVDMRQFEGTTLDILYFDISFIPGLKKLFPEFEEKTGIKINIETLSEQAARQKAQLELSTRSTAFDIVGVQSGNLPLYAQNGWVTPVESFFDNASISDPEKRNIEDFIPSTLQGMASGGTQYCLPFFAATVIYYYQIDKFKEAGITAPPQTFEELLSVSAKVNSDALPAIALRGSPASTAGNIWIFNLFFYGEGAKYFADFPNELTPQVNSPEAIKALETFIALKNEYGPEGGVNFVFDDVVTAMQQGNVVSVIDGAPLAGRILDPEQSKVSGNLGFAVVPGGPAGPKPSFASHGLCVSAYSDTPEAAYLFLEWALSAETMVKVSQNSAYLATTRTSVWSNPLFKEKYNFDFGGGEFLTAYRDSLNVAPADYYPPFAAWGIVSDRMGQAVQEAEIGSKSAEQALNDANADIAQILRDEGLLSE